MKNFVGFLVLLCSAGTLPPQTRRSYTVDLENENPAVGSLLIVVTEANPAGLPLAGRAFCSGVLIGDRVFLTAGHAVGPGLPELPPFIHAYMTFSRTAPDKATWICRSRFSLETQAASPDCFSEERGISLIAADVARKDGCCYENHFELDSHRVLCN
jgi:hypothetical protein